MPSIASSPPRFPQLVPSRMPTPTRARPLRGGIPALALLLLGLLWASAIATPVTAGPQLVRLTAELKEGTYRVSIELEGAFESQILDTIASGLPVTFEYRIEVFQRRSMWMDLVYLQQQVRVSVDFDSLTRQYSLRREVDGQVVDSSSTEKPEEMRAWMTRLAQVNVGAIEEKWERTGREQLRVKCRLASDFVFFFFPRALETRWAKIPLPLEAEGAVP